MSLSAWSLFLAASALLILTPGQDMYMVMTRSIARGRAAGLVTAAGISTGLLGHTLLVAVGLGALIRSSETLFLAIKIAGALYLVWLGIAALRAGATADLASAGGPRSRWKLFVEGALSNLANPKIVVFYLAFLPQFVPTDSGRPALVLAQLGVAFALLTFVIKAPIGYAAASLAGALRQRPSVQLWLNRVSGGILMLLGVRLLLEARSA
jgi:threonine/homoserine/homoserine lactone efflux protein